ncbi:GNAT family N-acetyltransferase [Streptomyces durmitorensis]|uniref:GNAT family N-acetyltransferase n=1 Tax=Streptomyces durmitorensis TaxID=319947 RepID=A0ABY4PM34_9ACTN|nr:GNAT family N-acetyltransferase [Streptomyces durmitorensis]UQT54686.1 GNAT family N-acetyltransferase [Streptomyces durmitorensis]
MQKPTSSSATQVVIKPVGARDEQLLAAIVELGDRFNKTLGFMPPAAYAQAAAENRLLAAMAGRKLVGYTLFSLPRQQIRLTHLCVDPDSRGQGIGRLLVDEISARHHDRSGIVLKCRKDYGYDAMWRQLGFEARNEVDGRGKDRKPLVVWSRDHNHPHLFSDLESTALLSVAMDCNVFADLHSSGERHGAQESRTLTSDWLAGLVDLAVLPQLKAEIGKITDSAERRRQLQATHGYTEPSVSRNDADRLIEELRSAVQAHIGDKRQLSQNDLRDLRYVAESSASGILFLVTRDEFLASLSDIAMSVCQVRILRPSDIVLHVDELTRAQVYQPGDLLGTSLTVQSIPAGQEQGHLVFLNKAAGERRNGFVAELRRLATHPARWVRQQVVDAEGTIAAIYGYGVRDGQLVVPLLRVLDGHPMHQTLARQILFRLRDHCRRSGVRLLSLTDSHLQPSVRIAAGEDGFREHDKALVTLVLDVCAEAQTVDEQAQSAAALIGLQVSAVPAAMPAAAAAALERAWWPAKITDSQLPCFLVPIQPLWSSDLFGVPSALTPRADHLGISREHVYYRAARSHGEKVPARILWYASSDKNQSVSAVIACSSFDTTVVDTGRSLYNRFRHLGVWGLDDILRACGDRGQARALLFSDTEIFPRPVGLHKVQSLAAQRGHPLGVQSIFALTPDLFSAIYQEGQPAQ